MYLEDGTETFNQFINNLAITSRAIGYGESYNRAGYLLLDGSDITATS